MSWTRRQFVSAAGAGAVGVLAADPLDVLAQSRRLPLLRGGRFDEGVLSGDPTPDGITLLTRLAGVEGRGGVRVEIARDRGFDKVVARSVLRTSPQLGHAVKARVTGLKPHTEYWYRFEGRTARSVRGRFRTSPPGDSREAVRFGVFYGLDYAAGRFGAFERMAREDLDFVLNLGSYISAEAAPEDPVRDPRDPRAARGLAAYRARYRDYRRDPDLRAMHAAHALVSTWDDGEVAAGYAGRGSAEYALPGARRAAYRAWFEAMPHYPRERDDARVYHSRRFGRWLELFALDTRQYRTDPPCGRDPEAGCRSKGDGDDLLGASQTQWLRDNLHLTPARWKVVGTPAPVADVVDEAGRPANLDGWQGYPAARESLLRILGPGALRDVAFLSGGLRRFYALELAGERGETVAPEFGCGTISAPARHGILNAASGTLEEDDPTRHGYAVVEVRKDALDVRFRTFESAATPSPQRGPGSAFRVRRGRPGIASA